MNPEDVTKLLTLTTENNVILKKMRRTQKIQAWIRGVYLFVLIGFFYGGYLLIKPFLESAFTTYTNFFSI